MLLPDEIDTNKVDVTKTMESNLSYSKDKAKSHFQDQLRSDDLCALDKIATSVFKVGNKIHKLKKVNCEMRKSET